MQFNVPQFLEIEDKIIGPLTIKQFGWMAGGGVVLFVFYRYLNFSYFIMFAIPLAALCFAFAFIKINGRPFLSFLISFFRYLMRPRLYVWRRKGR